jgi:transcriptional regulator with XRE-family HTH domain
MTSVFGSKLKKLMKSRGIKAITLAQRMGVSCAYISQIITGVRRPGRETLLKLSKSLEIPLEILLSLEAEDTERLYISRRVPVIDEEQINSWDFTNLDYPSYTATSFEYATTEDPSSFYIKTKDQLKGFGIESFNLILIEPNKDISNGDTILVSSPEGISIKRYFTNSDLIILTNDKNEPTILSKDKVTEGWKFFKISQCIKKF